MAEVFAYRHVIDNRLCELLASHDIADLAAVVELGIQHEQQHQELIVTDLKYLLGCNPLGPIYREAIVRPPTGALKPSGWKAFPGGIVTVGHEDARFSFDNERPRHQQFLSPFELQDRLVSAGEYLEFMDDGGYDRPELWLSLGWSTRCQHEWTAPLYWSKHNGARASSRSAAIAPLTCRAL